MSALHRYEPETCVGKLQETMNDRRREDERGVTGLRGRLVALAHHVIHNLAELDIGPVCTHLHVLVEPPAECAGSFHFAAAVRAQ